MSMCLSFPNATWCGHYNARYTIALSMLDTKSSEKRVYGYIYPTSAPENNIYQRSLTKLSSNVQTRRAHSFILLSASPSDGNSTSIPSHQHLRYANVSLRTQYTSKEDTQQVFSRTATASVLSPFDGNLYRLASRHSDGAEYPF